MQQSRSWKIVGHRGYPAKYPENTVMGFQAAIALGVDAIELDVQLTGDGVPVVLHDVRLDRTCDDIGSVLMRRWDDLKKVSAHQPNKFKQQFFPAYLASLEDVANAIVTADVQVFVEIKRQSLTQSNREAVLDSVLHATRALSKKRVLLSFDYKILEIAKQRSDLAVGWCVKNYSPLAQAQALALEPDFLICSPSNIGSAALWPGNWQWFVYDIKTSEEARKWVGMGASYIETDFPDSLLDNG